jgi:hypothetical protein
MAEIGRVLRADHFTCSATAVLTAAGNIVTRSLRPLPSRTTI